MNVEEGVVFVQTKIGGLIVEDGYVGIFLLAELVTDLLKIFKNASVKVYISIIFMCMCVCIYIYIYMCNMYICIYI